MKHNIDHWIEQMLKKHGWYLHYLTDDILCPYSINIHTHGLPAKYDHLDLQICFPIDKESAHEILCDIAGEIRNGKKFSAGIKYTDVFKGSEIEFAEAKESERVVLRLILPDKYGKLRGEYSDQWKGCRIYPSSN